MGARCTDVLIVKVSPAEREHMERLAELRQASVSEIAREAMGLHPETDPLDWPEPRRRLRLVSDSRRPARRG